VKLKQEEVFKTKMEVINKNYLDKSLLVQETYGKSWYQLMGESVIA
jgi:hypothetical protein